VNVTELPSLDTRNLDIEKKARKDVSLGTILIVDDNPANLRALKLILEREFFHVRAAISGELALDSMKVELPDIVLLDIMMPNKNGFEVCEEMKANELTKDIPVLFISALDDLADKIKAFSVGGVDYIPKPFYAHEVIARVNTHITLYKSQKELKRVNQKLYEHSINLERLNKELNSFSYSVSHDLRSPLRSIAGFAQILLEDYHESLDETANNYIDTILRNSKHMEQLIDGLLQLSKISQFELVRADVNLSDTVKQSLNHLLQLDESSNAEVKVADNIICSCSPTLANIAISNLLNNALKYTKYSKDPKVEFGVAKKNGKDTYFIRDNGIGLDMKFAEKIFLPFHRLQRDKKYEGSGIGLATVKRVIDVHHGDIWVESEIDKGSTFYFRFN